MTDGVPLPGASGRARASGPSGPEQHEPLGRGRQRPPWWATTGPASRRPSRPSRGSGSPPRVKSSGRGSPSTSTAPKTPRRSGDHDDLPGPALCDNLDIVQNMFLGHETLRHRLLDETSMELAARQTLADLHGDRPSAPSASRWRCSQAASVSRWPWRKAVMPGAQARELDEPTAALGVAQTQQVLDLISGSPAEGTAVLAYFAQPHRCVRGGRRDRGPLPSAKWWWRARRRTSTARSSSTT